jgi:hypothetical protein
VQGSGIEPSLNLVMESDLKSLSDYNHLFKFADDTNFLVPEHTNMSMADEFKNKTALSKEYKMIINYSKTKKTVFHRPHPSKFKIDPAVSGVEIVHSLMLWEIIKRQFQL